METPTNGADARSKKNQKPLIAGIVVAVGAVVGIYWRKAKKKVNKALGVDENKNKEVESDDIVVENDGEEQK